MNEAAMDTCFSYRFIKKKTYVNIPRASCILRMYLEALVSMPDILTELRFGTTETVMR